MDIDPNKRQIVTQAIIAAHPQQELRVHLQTQTEDRLDEKPAAITLVDTLDEEWIDIKDDNDWRFYEATQEELNTLQVRSDGLWKAVLGEQVKEIQIKYNTDTGKIEKRHHIDILISEGTETEHYSEYHRHVNRKIKLPADGGNYKVNLSTDESFNGEGSIKISDITNGYPKTLSRTPIAFVNGKCETEVVAPTQHAAYLYKYKPTEYLGSTIRNTVLIEFIEE